MGCSSSHIADEASPPADAVRLDRQTIVVILVAALLGAVVWRCRSFWIAVPIHAYQMFVLDLFCAYRTAHL